MKYSGIVSVIIPVYNGDKYISKALESVLRQTYKNIELIVVNDGSTDTTQDILDKYSKADSRIKVYQIKNTGLPSKVRNFAVSKSKGSFLAFLDADDIWLPKKLEIQLKEIHTNSEIALVYSSAIVFGDVNFFSPLFGLLPLPFRAARSFDQLLKRNSICCSTVLLRKSIFLKMNGFDEEELLKAVEDYDLWLRICKNNKISYCKNILVKYRIHSKGISKDKMKLNNSVIKMFKYRGYDELKNGNPSNSYSILNIIGNVLHLIFIVYLYLIQYSETDE
jgi:teichuronic acid biosynthesis glycosyltransferase TuaG